MKIRITVENPAGNIKGLPMPYFDLVFGEQTVGCVKVYLVDRSEAISDCGPSPFYMVMDVKELAGVVAALREAS